MISYINSAKSACLNFIENPDAPRDYIEENWVFSKDTNWGKKEGLSRVAFLALTPTSVIVTIADTAYGIFSGMRLWIPNQTTETQFNSIAVHICSSEEFFTRPFILLLLAFNPEAKVPCNRELREKVAKLDEPWIQHDGPSYFYEKANVYITEPLIDKAHEFATSTNWLVRNLASRITYTFGFIAKVIIRVVDLIFGLIAGVFALVSVGKIESLNNFAYKCLKSSFVVAETFLLFNRIINPWSFDFPSEPSSENASNEECEESERSQET